MTSQLEIKISGAAEDNGETNTLIGTFNNWRDAITFLVEDLQGKHSKKDWWRGGETNEPWSFYSLSAIEILTDSHVYEYSFGFCACDGITEMGYEKAQQEAPKGS